MPATKKSSTQELIEELLRVLESQRRLGSEAYPLPLQQLRTLTDHSLTDKKFYTAIGNKAFKERAIVTYSSRSKRYKSEGNLIALQEDAVRLAADSRLLIEALRNVRTKTIHARSLADLKTGLNEKLQRLFQETVKAQMESGALPEGVAWILDRIPKLFLLEDLQPATARSTCQIEPKTTVISFPSTNFATAFIAAFDRLDQQRGGHNFVSLVDLRRELADYSREAFDNGLRALRLAGRFDLSAAEGRYGISAEEQQAGIREGNTLLLHVSKME